jgi:hypothetical protein
MEAAMETFISPRIVRILMIGLPQCDADGVFFDLSKAPVCREQGLW